MKKLRNSALSEINENNITQPISIVIFHEKHPFFLENLSISFKKYLSQVSFNFKLSKLQLLIDQKCDLVL